MTNCPIRSRLMPRLSVRTIAFSTSSAVRARVGAINSRLSGCGQPAMNERPADLGRVLHLRLEYGDFAAHLRGSGLGL